MTEARRHFVTALEKAHSLELRRFLAARLRNSADLPDLVQEIYLRLLRLKDYEAIRNPRAYLYTIAGHVLHEHRLRHAGTSDTTDSLDAMGSLQAAAPDNPAEEADIERRMEALGRSLEEHSPRAYAVLIMYRCEDLTLKEIGQRLGISSVMAHKYLVRAIRYCDEHLRTERGHQE